MGWDQIKHLAERIDDLGDDANLWEHEYTCLVCGKTPIRNQGAFSNHAKAKHPDELDAVAEGWRPDDDVVDQDEDVDEIDTRNREETEDRGLEALEDRDPQQGVDLDQRQATKWSIPGGNDPPQNDDDAQPDPVDRTNGERDDVILDAPRDDDDVEEVDQLKDRQPHDEPPQMRPEEVAPLIRTTVRVVSNRLEARGVEPIRDDEEEALVGAWQPVVAKYLPYYGAEMHAGLTTLLVLGPRFMEARDKAKRGELDTDQDQDDQQPAQPEPTPSPETGRDQAKQDFLAELAA